MKKSIVVCLFCIGCVCLAAASDPAVISMDIVKAKSLALDAIKAKYPAAVSVNLQYTGMVANVATNDAITITVNYLAGDSEKPETIEENGFRMAKTRQETYVVQMNHLGQIENVSKGSSLCIRSINQKNWVSQPVHATGKSVPGR